MLNHKDHEAAFNRGMENRGDNHRVEYNSNEDRQVMPRVSDSTRFVKHDGDDEDLKLAAKIKHPVDNSRMPTIKDAYKPKGNREIS